MQILEEKAQSHKKEKMEKKMQKIEINKADQGSDLVSFRAPPLNDIMSSLTQRAPDNILLVPEIQNK